jgi:hypothetical protein
MLEKEIIHHEYKNKLLPDLHGSKLAYHVELNVNCLHSFVINILALNRTLINKIIIHDTSTKSMLILRKREMKKQDTKKGRKFVSIIDFDPEDITLADIQMSYNDLAELIHQLLEHILVMDSFCFGQKCYDSQGKYEHWVYWWCSQDIT